jgi:hypothetical protein
MGRTTTFRFLPLLLAACLAPGVDIAPQPGDFAFVQIQLLG